jgi:hypothetical protein
MPCSAYTRDKVLDAILDGPVFVSLHSGDPGLRGALELSGGGYARQKMTFKPAAAGVKVSATGATFECLPECSVKNVGLWDAPTSGNFLYAIDPTGTEAFGAGDSALLKAGAVKITQR